MAANRAGMIPAKVFWASRLVRFDIGSRRLAVLASHTVIRARGRTENPACRAVPTTTRVSRTAVASKDRKTVHTTATIATTRHTKNADRAPPKTENRGHPPKNPSLASQRSHHRHRCHERQDRRHPHQQRHHADSWKKAGDDSEPRHRQQDRPQARQAHCPSLFPPGRRAPFCPVYCPALFNGEVLVHACRSRRSTVMRIRAGRCLCPGCIICTLLV